REGGRDSGPYVRSIRRMDDAAFRASVFAEQKQIASFSGQTTAERRKLVLQLLGITPVDAAKDQARKDGREAMQQHERARGLLPDVEPLKAEVAEAELAAKSAGDAEAAGVKQAAEAEQAHASRRAEHEQLVVTANEYERVVAEGKAVRDQHGAAEKRAADLTTELAALTTAAEALATLEPDAAGLPAAEERLAAVQAVERARATHTDLSLPEEPAR